MMEIFKSVSFFILAGLCEIAGGYLVWLWFREGKSIWYAALGAVLLVLYGIVPTLQPANFGRVYAAYGGVLSFSHYYGAGVSIKHRRTDSI